MQLFNMIRIFMFIVFISIYAIVYTVTTNDKDEQLKHTLEQQIENLKNVYRISTNRFELISNNLYTLVVNKPEITELIYFAKHSKTDSERNLYREKLYTQMRPYLEQLNKSGVIAMLFSFEDNRTFLRVHKPDKYGDDLSSDRYGFTYANENKKPIRGFEHGKILHAFRNIFPLYYNDEFIGSVDIAFSSKILQENVTLLYNMNTHFILDKSIFEPNIFKAQNKVRYVQSLENENFLFAITDSQSDSIFQNDKIELGKTLKDDINRNVKHHAPFALYDKKGDAATIITFLPIKNIKENKTVAYLVSYSNNYYLENMLQRYIWTNILFFFGLLSLYFLIIYNVKQRFILQVRVNAEVERNRLQDKKLLENSKIAQEKLNKSMRLFGNNVIASNTDTRGIITYASKALCDISGYSEDELLGQPHSILRHPDMKSEVFKDMWETIQAGKPWKGEIKNRKKDGGSYWVRTSIMPDFSRNGEIIGYTSIRQDITPQKVKEQFMANMSHELRTPLNAIIGFSTILKKRLKDTDEYDLVKRISSSSKSLLILINDILDLSKIQDAKFTIEDGEFNAYDEIQEYSKLFEGLTAEKDIVFKNDASKNLQAVFVGDWLRISQILLNLISNSIKFTPNNGEIEFKSDYQDNHLILTITDNGIGMNQEVQDRVFQPFEQADGSTTRKYGGTGLGLSITQSLVELMNGTIELESEEGVGTTFTVTIPLDKVDNVEYKKEASIEEFNDKEPLGIHILVAEDNKTNQILIEMILEEFGITCDIVNDGLEAVDMYDPGVHSLILMDENMPYMNGVEAMKTIKQKHKDKSGPIIALTANAMEGDKERFLEYGMDGYVSKPINQDELYETIKELLNRKRK